MIINIKKPLPNRGPKIQCQIYGKKGNIVNKCFLFRDILIGQSIPSFCIRSFPFSHVIKNIGLDQTSHCWLLDLGAIHHLTNDVNSLASRIPYYGFEKVKVGNGDSLSVSHLKVLFITSRVYSSSIILSYFTIKYWVFIFQRKGYTNLKFHWYGVSRYHIF